MVSDKRTIDGASEALSAVPLLAGLDGDVMEAVAKAAVRREYETSHVIFVEGEPNTGLYVVQDGWLKVVKFSPAGREQVLRFVGAGQVLGQVSVFSGSPSPATVIALELSTVWIVCRETVLQLLDPCPGLSRVIIQNLAGRVQHLVTLVEDLSLRTVEARLARFLLEQSAGETVQRRRWETQAEMAARLGTVLDVLNRALQSLIEEGLVEVERHQIRILDREGLEARANPGK